MSETKSVIFNYFIMMNISDSLDADFVSFIIRIHSPIMVVVVY